MIVLLIDSREPLRSAAAAAIALGISMTATVASSQQVIPFGDVPAMVDFSEAEIAAAMSISRGAVKSHTARGMAALRAELERESW